MTALIFDMDGILLDSEPLWWQAGVEALRAVGVSLDERHFTETLGLRTDAAIAHWYRRFPWNGPSLEQVEQAVHTRVLELIHESAEPLPGVQTLLESARAQQLPIGLCSSSPYSVIDAVLARLGLSDHFDVVHSAEVEPYGKPHPAPYLGCAARLRVEPQRCVAFEDSLAGAISAKAAQMKVIAIPNAACANRYSFDFCDARLESMEHCTPTLLAKLLAH